MSSSKASPGTVNLFGNMTVICFYSTWLDSRNFQTIVVIRHDLLPRMLPNTDDINL